MNISKLGHSQAGASAQPVNVPKASAGAAGSAAASDTTASTPASAKQRRIADFAQRIDKRLENVMNQKGLSDRQVDALKALQDKFQGQIKRATAAASEGELHGAMQNILGALHSGVEGILGHADTDTSAAADADASAKATTISGDAKPDGTAGRVDRLA